MDKNVKIAVIGGGASGMAAAITAARMTDSVCVIEAQPRVGKKLLATGNGRCNISNTDISPEHYRSSDINTVARMLSSVSPTGVMQFIASLGLVCIEEDGRLYPRSRQAATVLDALRAEMERLHIDVLCDCRVQGVDITRRGFLLSTGGGTICAERVIIACGSEASPQLGGCKDGSRLLERLGHHPSRMKAVLTPIAVKSEYLSALKGVRTQCRLSLMQSGVCLHCEDGELQFTEKALSGIACFQLSSRIARLKAQDVSIHVDLMPEYSPAQLYNMLCSRRKSFGHLSCEAFLAGVMHKRVAVCVMKSAKVAPLSRTASSMSDDELKALAKIIKDWRFPVTSLSDMKQAQAAAGGIPLCEVDDSLQSKYRKGLFICGELLDCDGDCGGYNLHWAWCSGIIAGRGAALSLKGGVSAYDDIEQY
ncbi:MAG: aminoacetone oxidase family FAD-binding enzyme [Clostridia bacterium]|nr:aminoacetone oxidase family FAD-binding enzyme [Clostridia bacterium]